MPRGTQRALVGLARARWPIISLISTVDVRADLSERFAAVANLVPAANVAECRRRPCEPRHCG